MKIISISLNTSDMLAFFAFTAKLATGKSIHYAAGNVFFIDPKPFGRKAAIFSVASWQSCWIILFLKTENTGLFR